MKTISKLWLAGGLAAVMVTVAGCSGDSNNNVNVTPQGSAGPPAGPPAVPESAGTTVASFIAYLLRLDRNDEQSEPLIIRDSFAVPPDEVNESLPLT